MRSMRCADPCGVQRVLDGTRGARTRDGGNESERTNAKEMEGYKGYTKYHDEGGQRIQGETRMERVRERGSVRR